MTTLLDMPDRMNPDTLIRGTSLMRRQAQIRHAREVRSEQVVARAARTERLWDEIAAAHADVEAREAREEKAALDLANQKQLAWLQLEGRMLRALNPIRKNSCLSCL